MAKTVCIDFDACIHKYSKGWLDGSIYDVPVDCVFAAIVDLLMNGYSVVIFSTRKPRQIKKWMDSHIVESEMYGYGLGDPHDYTYPKFGFTCKVIPWWKILFSKSFFWNSKDVVGITNIKIAAHCYIDDRALKFEGNWEKTLLDLQTFKTYQQ